MEVFGFDLFLITFSTGANKKFCEGSEIKVVSLRVIEHFLKFFLGVWLNSLTTTNLEEGSNFVNSTFSGVV